MPETRDLLLFLGAALVLNLTPGPDMLYIATRSAAEGRAAGFASALGIAAGCFVHIFAAAFGLSALLESVPAAYDAVRYAGAAYLIWLGMRALLRPAAATPDGTLRRATLGAVFRQGVVTNVLNPKVALFFLAFLPQFVDPAAGHVAARFLLLGVLFNTSGTLVNLGIAWAASRAGEWTRERLSAAAWFERLTGAVFVGLGMRLALARRG